MKKLILLTSILFCAASLQAQVIIGHDTAKSGRLQTGVGVDSAFGVTTFGNNTFTANAGTLGDSSGNNKQQTIFAFTANSTWLTAYSNVDKVEFSFRVGSINSGGGTPSTIQISLLAINDGTADPWTVATGAPLLAALGTASGTTIGNHTLDITTVLSNAATQPSATNDTLWFGLSAGFSNNSEANNVLLNMTNGDFQLPTLSVTAIPEPSTGLLLLGGMGALTLLRRRRK